MELAVSKLTKGIPRLHPQICFFLCAGISTRLFCEVFDTIALLQRGNARHSITVSVSYKEIYCDAISDLLTADKSANRRSSRETTLDYETAVHDADGTREFRVHSPEDMCKYKEHGDQMRKNSNHRLSCCSASLSHAIFSISVQLSPSNDPAGGGAPAGRIHIVDLASSDASACLQEHRHHAQEEQPTADMVHAAAVVNTNLRDLCSALHVSATEERGTLRPRAQPTCGSLAGLVQGAHKAVVLACISPSHTACEESLATLEFASRCSAQGGRPEQSASPAAANAHTLDSKFLFRNDAESPKAKEEKPKMRAAGAWGRGGAVDGDENGGREAAVRRFRELLAQQKRVVKDLSALNAQAARSIWLPTPLAAGLAGCSDGRGVNVDGAEGRGGGAPAQRQIAAKHEELHHLTALLEQERQAVRKLWENTRASSSDRQTILEIRHSTLGKMKLSEISAAVLPAEPVARERESLVAQIAILEQQVSDARVALSSGKTFADSHRAALMAQLKTIAATADTAAQLRMLLVAHKRAGEAAEAASKVAVLRARGLQAAERLQDLLTDALDAIILHSVQAQKVEGLGSGEGGVRGCVARVSDPLSAFEDLEYSRTRMANVRAKIGALDAQSPPLTAQEVEVVQASLRAVAEAGVGADMVAAAAGVLQQRGEAQGVLAVEEALRRALEAHARWEAERELRERREEIAGLRVQLEVVQGQCQREKQQRMAAGERVEALQVELGGLLRQLQHVVPQVQRQLDSVTRRRSLEMHEAHEQSQQHDIDRREWQLEKRALNTQLLDAQAAAASARCDLGAADAKIKKLNAAAVSAEGERKQLQAMLALCRKARAAQSPSAKSEAALGALVDTQHEYLRALHTQVDDLHACLRQALDKSRGGESEARGGQHGQLSGGSVRAGGSCRGAVQHALPKENSSADGKELPEGELPVFATVLQAAAELSVEQVRVLSSLDTAGDSPRDAEESLGRRMSDLLQAIVAASSQSSEISRHLTQARSRVSQLELLLSLQVCWSPYPSLYSQCLFPLCPTLSHTAFLKSKPPLPPNPSGEAAASGLSGTDRERGRRLSERARERGRARPCASWCRGGRSDECRWGQSGGGWELQRAEATSGGRGRGRGGAAGAGDEGAGSAGGGAERARQTHGVAA